VRRVVVALSGGVDSGVAAALLVEQGYQVVAVTLRLWAEPRAQGAANLRCAPEALDRARSVAGCLDIPFHVLDAQSQFYGAVVERFIAEYAAARTPNPCIPCNREVRFGLLLRWARQQGADFLATGHYARVRRVGGSYQLLRGRDQAKDQSYVLHALTQEQLAHALFPLGDLTKVEVRGIAKERGLPVTDQPESQDACFLADGDYRRFLAARLSDVIRPGPILDSSGQVLGQHTGLVNYTVGQRKGIGIAAPRPFYVLSLDPQRNALIVGTADELRWRECNVVQTHYISGEEPPGPFAASAEIRYRHHGVSVAAVPLPDRRLYVRFARPQRDVTPGQYLVLYEEEVVLGGGVICAPWEVVLQ
jgi:tRNA-specific 2-thiouridylase